MILDRLLLHNFGVFWGRHQMELRPPSPDRPIVLVGGLNGAGKTTLMDALQLALYGKLARCSNRGGLSYPDYLRHSIHRGARVGTGAAVEVAFSHMVHGERESIRVHRSWYETGKSVRERVEVLLNGRPDRVLSERWLEHMEEILPLRIAPLFFFDGEKIEGLADTDSSAELLRTAVRSLLGLDLVDVLRDDLAALRRRKRVEVATAVERHAIDEASAEMERLREEHRTQLQQLAAVVAAAGRVRAKLSEVGEKLAAEGGQLYEQRHELEDQRRALEAAKAHKEDGLRELAHGDAPLLLVLGQLASLARQAERERDARRKQLLGELLGDRDRRLLEAARASGIETGGLAAIATWMAADREATRPDSAVRPYLDLAPEAEAQLQRLGPAAQRELAESTGEELRELARTERELVELERRLVGLPPAEAVADLLQRRDALQEQLAAYERDLDDHHAKVAGLEAAVAQANSRLARLLERRVQEEWTNREAQRLIDHIERSRGSLERFGLQVLLGHIERIATSVRDGFNQLVRKEGFLGELSIDPKTFAISMADRDGRPLASERMSAGERQLLAVAMLWGLGREAGRKLPVVIDTPLGRLDSAHRDSLVERYFPDASHQVVLLSTDKEIEASHLERLAGRIGRSYRLDYDDETRATTMRDGYFAAGGAP